MVLTAIQSIFKLNSNVIQTWFKPYSNVIQMRFKCDSKGLKNDFLSCFFRVLRVNNWCCKVFKRNSKTIQTLFKGNSNVNYLGIYVIQNWSRFQNLIKDDSKMIQTWFKRDSNVIQTWFKRDLNLIQTRLKRYSNVIQYQEEKYSLFKLLRITFI